MASSKKRTGVKTVLTTKKVRRLKNESLVRCEVISVDDLEEFSDETKKAIERMVSW